MDNKQFSQVISYSDVFNIIARGVHSAKELDEEMKARSSDPSALKRRRDWLNGNPAYLIKEEGEVEIDAETLAGDIRLLWDTVIPKDYEGNLQSDDVRKTEDLESKIADLISERDVLAYKVAELEEANSRLLQKISEGIGHSLKEEMQRKVLVASSIEVGPKKHLNDDIFIYDTETLLDVDKCVAKYGGELESYYEEIPTDSDDKSMEAGHELSERNHALSIMKVVGTRRFFNKRIADNKEAAKIEQRTGKLFQGHNDSRNERQKERERILHNRFVSLNNIIQNDRLTNQEKLMMYAMNSEYHNTNIERLLVYAGNHCINADLLIQILEDPDVCTTYENTVGFLSQFADASEFRMKLNLARELIEGKWYIVADYNGKKTKFQLVPIDEFNELRMKAGLPVSRFSYKEEVEDGSFPDEKEEEPIKKPDFVKSIGGSQVELFDDGFESAAEYDIDEYDEDDMAP